MLNNYYEYKINNERYEKKKRKIINKEDYIRKEIKSHPKNYKVMDSIVNRINIYCKISNFLFFYILYQ